FISTESSEALNQPPEFGNSYIYILDIIFNAVIHTIIPYFNIDFFKLNPLAAFHATCCGELQILPEKCVCDYLFFIFLTTKKYKFHVF
ncbi:MAG: hypothetical protein ACD_79C00769G0001, partial [uncultured bacterium]